VVYCQILIVFEIIAVVLLIGDIPNIFYYLLLVVSYFILSEHYILICIYL